MKLEEYYKIAEEKISEHDTHSFRCKQWLVVIVGALIAGAFSFYRGTTEFPWPLFWAGILATIFVFLIDMSVRHVSSMFIEYTKYLDKRVSGGDEKWNERTDAINAWLSDMSKSKNNWRGLFRFILTNLTRARTILFYLAAVIVVGFGVWLPTTVPAAPHPPDAAPSMHAKASHHLVATQPAHKTHRPRGAYRPGKTRQSDRPQPLHKTRLHQPVSGWLIGLKYLKVLLVGPVLVILVLGLMILWILCKPVYKLSQLHITAKKELCKQDADSKYKLAQLKPQVEKAKGSNDSNV